MREKWYLQSWFIALLFAFWPLYGIPVVAGAILLFIQNRESKKLSKMYGDFDSLTERITALEEEYASKNQRLTTEYNTRNEMLQSKYRKDEEDLKQLYGVKKSSLQDEMMQLRRELSALNTDVFVSNYNFSDYDSISSEECRNELSLLKNEELEFVKSDSALIISSDGTKKQINDNGKQILRCFNSECDNILINLSIKNIDSMRKKVTTSFESLNRIFYTDGVQMSRDLLKLKLEQLNLVYTYELKKDQEREQQKAIKEQMMEEEKVRREIEREKAKIEKDQTQCSREVNKLIEYMQKTDNDIEKQLYIDKIRELEDKLKDLEAQKENVLEREANARAGFVYVISNIGSFGEDVFKIGMTRRLEPMDRIKELSSASVPFDFDVHAMIFSDDAPSLENTLHKHFEVKSVNRVNFRKEFFRVTIDEIESVVKTNFNNTVTFTKIPVAKDFRQTLSIIESEKSL